MKKIIKYGLISVVVVLLIVFGGFYIWSEQTYKPSEQLHDAVNEKEWKVQKGFITLEPNKSNGAGIVLYPGAKVEPVAYAYYGKQLAAEGYTVMIADVAFHFALLDVNKAAEAKKLYPQLKQWYIGGHSLGGVAAASYAIKNQDEVAGIIFLGSYPSESSDFADTDMPILSLYAEYDGLSTLEKINETKNLLSKETTMHEIKGGNHAQFGMYGKQKGDNEAKISAIEQQREMALTTMTWLENQEKK
ncbi:alpha/beta fold hydrolase [Peribacillus muralis]|uniref:alpha/beta fold hydrolase n=1 Tax=Peribacillus muralis TaxID=264697 RepID=UPI00366AB556